MAKQKVSEEAASAFEKAFGEEVPVEAKAEPTPEPKSEEPAAEPVAAAPDAPAAPEVAAPEIDYKAENEKLKSELSAREQEHLRQREAMLRDFTHRRFRNSEPPAAQPLTTAQQTSAAQQGIPIKWDDKGNATIDPEFLKRFQTDDGDIDRRVEERVAQRLAPIEQERMRAAVIAGDTRIEPLLGELGFAYRWLDSQVQFRQEEMRAAPFANVDAAVDFIEYSGIAERFRLQYPHIAPTRAEMAEFVISAVRPSVDNVRSFVGKVVGRKFGSAAPAVAAHPAFDPPSQTLSPDKPRPHAERGGSAPAKTGNSMERELEELTEKVNNGGEWTLSAKERERVSWLTKAIQKKAS